jgi:predicted tellurium resistance membrane protein TerC
MTLIERFPIFVWLGAGLLGWVAGEMLISDPWLVQQLGEAGAHRYEYVAAAAGALLVVGIGYVLRRRMQEHVKADHSAGTP